jgi:tRNA (guanine-N7-)-methyltransferase
MKNQNNKRPHPDDSADAGTDTVAGDDGNNHGNNSENNNNENASSVNTNANTNTSEKREAITPDGEMPQKRFYRSRAHCNPLSHNDTFEYPSHPDQLDWGKDHYPSFTAADVADAVDATGDNTNSNNVSGAIVPTVLDIGCGFGGLTTALATVLPDKLVLGLEIRAKVTEYVRLRILALRKENPGQYNNCSVLRSNTMKHMPNFFQKNTLDKIFFCFPDPHFKKKNHSRRIVAEKLLTEYAYFLKDGGKLYTITDVEDLHNWHVKHCRAHPMFRELSNEELEGDPCVKAMYNETEEGKKVERAGTKKYYAVYEKLEFEKAKLTEDAMNITAENFWN